VSWSTTLACSWLIGSTHSPIAWSKSSLTLVSIQAHEVKATVISIRRYPAMSEDPLDATLLDTGGNAADVGPCDHQ
jgi:hypothetical protein